MSTTKAAWPVAALVFLSLLIAAAQAQSSSTDAATSGTAVGLLAMAPAAPAEGGGQDGAPVDDADTLEPVPAAGETPGPARLLQIERRQDGLAIDGQPVHDMDGEIIDFGADPDSGDIVYLVGLGAERAAVKRMNGHRERVGTLIGHLNAVQGRVEFEGLDGRSAGGGSAKATSRGLLLIRSGSLAVIDLDHGDRVISLPPGWQVAGHQNGDVAATGYLLLQRGPEPARQRSAVADLVGTFRRSAQPGDYALFGLDGGNLVELDVQASGNLVYHHYNCRRRNAVLNQCAGVHVQEGLFEANGRPNYTHYYWKIDWRPTRHGPMAVVMERKVREVNVIRLDQGERYNAFQRTLGIVGFQATPTDDGSLRVVAQWAFRDHVLDDVASLWSGEGSAAP